MSLESMNGIEYVGAHLKFKVPGFREKGDGHYYYRIVVQFTLQEPYKRDDFEYTYQNCLELQKQLQQQCPDVAQLPGVGMFDFKPTNQEAERRRIELEKWLSAIVWRCDVLGSSDFQNFCNLHKLIEPKWLRTPIPSLQLNQGHLFPVQDFYYEPDTQVCFVLTTDDSIASKMQGLVGLFGKTKTAVHSQVICYRLDVDHQGDPIVRQLWTLSYQQRGMLLHWDEKLTILSVGFDNGNIICIRVETQKGYQDQVEFCQIHKHTSCVTGIAMNSLTGHLYSIGRDKSLITTDLANPSNILKEKDFPHELNCLVVHGERLFIADAIGSIYIFNFENGPIEPAHQIKQDIKMNIISLQFCKTKQFLVCNSREGYLSVFEVGRCGREKLTTQVTLIKTVPNNHLQFSLGTKEIYFSYGSSIVVMDSLKMKYLYSLRAHEQGVGKIQLIEELGVLLSCGKDYGVKFWQYKYFPHIVMNDEIIPFRKEPQILSTQQQQPKQEQQGIELKEKVQLRAEIEDLDHWQ